MKRHVAATLLVVLGLLVIDSHVNWVPHDDGTLLEVSGRVFDPKGWASEHWRQLHTDCRGVNSDVPQATANAVLQAIQQHSLPDSKEAQLLQLHQQGNWALAEVTFKTLNPSILFLRQTEGVWQIQDSAVWSGSTAPWHAANFVRRYLRQQAPAIWIQLHETWPESLLDCFEIDLVRYGQGPGGLGPVDLSVKDRP
ncbi:MAG: hypothetical protein RJB17_1282 [Pseudomonadota bacterium]